MPTSLVRQSLCGFAEMFCGSFARDDDDDEDDKNRLL